MSGRATAGRAGGGPGAGAGTLAPRVVVVSRRSELDELLARHGTRAAAAWYLRERGRDLAEVVDRHEALQSALTTVGAAVPADWRRGAARWTVPTCPGSSSDRRTWWWRSVRTAWWPTSPSTCRGSR
ncbi:hypothetical protein ACIBXA_24615 [Micromonospora echinaurantiaca]|uniref:hypothetical protein n=1 Tax=Micromonospora echinaurantiaca TaxID=47857 RepID=UPI0037A13AC5